MQGNRLISGHGELPEGFAPWIIKFPARQDDRDAGPIEFAYARMAAAAGLGLSLTLRGLARKVTFVTAHARGNEPLDLDWHALADPQATLAVYMGKAAAAQVARNLLKQGLADDTPVIVVENVSLPQERHISTRLDLLPLAARSLGDGPTLLLIGQAMKTRTRSRVTLALTDLPPVTEQPA